MRARVFASFICERARSACPAYQMQRLLGDATVALDLQVRLYSEKPTNWKSASYMQKS
jgi:hypothetical protein